MIQKYRTYIIHMNRTMILLIHGIKYGVEVCGNDFYCSRSCEIILIPVPAHDSTIRIPIFSQQFVLFPISMPIPIDMHFLK